MSRLKFVIFSLFITCFKIVNGSVSCSDDTFQCHSGTCVNYSHVCDNVHDCDDGSDELNCGPTCPEGWFQCSNGNCVLMRWKCDGENDCGDGSDELICGPIADQCSNEEYRCHDNKKCILLSWVCDGHVDCQDGSDEASGCVRQARCDGFTCVSNKECLPNRWHCDGVVDCPDESDEFNCTGPHNSYCKEEDLKFYCDDRSICLERDLVCNGIRNCVDGSDEGGQCDVKSCESAGCSHSCFQTPRKAHCYCPSGYMLAPNSTICKDVDECANVSMPACSHDCRNTAGSFSCSCRDGYELQPASSKGVAHLCQAVEPEPILLYSASRELKMIKLRSGLMYSLKNELNHAIGIDYDSHEDRIYWTEIASGAEAIRSCHMDGSDVAVIVDTGISVVEDVAIDWVGHNLYFTDSSFMRLVVCSKRGKHCRVLLEGIRQPRALIVESPKGTMYWTDWSHTPLIETSHMDGSNRVALVSTGLVWPNGLALDHALNRLYWIDAKLGRIEYVTLDARHERRLVFEEMMLHPFGFAVFEDTFYWTDWSRHTLESCNKFTGGEHTVLLKEKSENIPMGVHIYHPITQPATRNPCLGNSCGHLCLLVPNNRYVCKCATGYKMASKNPQCVREDDRRIFLSVDHSIYEFIEAQIGRHELRLVETIEPTLIGSMSYNPYDESIIYADLGNKEIAMMDLLTESRKVLLPHVESVECLAVDWISKNLYWADSVRKTLEVSRLNGDHKALLMATGVDQILDIALIPHKGIMFVSVYGSRPRIDKMNMDGSDRHIFLDFENDAPSSLAVDYEKELLYWTDTHAGTIEWTTLDGKKRFTLEKYVGHPRNVAVANGTVVWTDLSDGVHLWTYVDTGNILKTIKLNSDVSETNITLIDLLMIDSPYPTVDNGCKNNGGCSHLCLPNEKSYVCACPMGLMLADDKQNCKSKIQCSSEEFTCLNKECVPLSMTCDAFKDCSDGSDEANCRPVCSSDEFQCGDHECIPQSWVCDRASHCKDGSDELDCKYPTCPPDWFTCHSNGGCIVNSWHCDGHPDCDDRSDEVDCSPVNSTCRSDEFHCLAGHCVPFTWRCDGEIDCTDASDEDQSICQIDIACSETEFKCDNHRCISSDLNCNGQDDCGDNSDEKICVSYTCPLGTYGCPRTKHCIVPGAICDGVNDCLDNEDEEDCPETRELESKGCKDTEFHCVANDHCIPLTWTCDGESDCGDSSDEKLAHCHVKDPDDVIEKPVMPVYKDLDELIHGIPAVFNDSTTNSSGVGRSSCAGFDYKCQNGDCVSIHDVCNHRADCKDNSDEGSFCSYACEGDHGGCSDLCVPTPLGPKCECRSGYQLEDNAKTCFDIDECMYLGACSQRCVNVPGTFACSCASGYVLRSDKRSCKAEGAAPELLMGFTAKLLSYHLGSNHMSSVIQNNGYNIRDVDFDSKTGDIYWVDIGEGTITRYIRNSRHEEVIIKGLRSPNALAVDWVTRQLVYWESKGDGYVVLCNLDGESCVNSVHIGQKDVENLVVDSRVGVLYWCTWSTDGVAADGTIERAFLSGKRKYVLASSKLIWPIGLTADYLHDTLYWADAHLGVIEVMDMDGNNRRILTREVGQPMALALFEDQLYWADWKWNTIKDCDKYMCEVHTSLLEHVIKVHDMLVYHPVQQPNVSNNCMENCERKCSHVCAPTRNGYVCLCPNHMEFNDTANTICVPDKVSSREGNFGDGCKSGKLCFNGGNCKLDVDGKEVCECQSNFTGVRCESRVHSVAGGASGAAVSDGGSHGWIAGVVVGIAFVLAAAAAALFYCRRFGPEKFRNAFAPMQFHNPDFGANGEPVEDEEDDGTCYNPNIDSYKSYSNPMFNANRVDIDMNSNVNGAKVKFHVVESSASLDSSYTNESSSTLLDYIDKSDS